MPFVANNEYFFGTYSISKSGISCTKYIFFRRSSLPETAASETTLTRMHSSRMRTARSLTVSRSICHACPLCYTHPSPCHACPPPCMPPAMHTHPHHAMHAPPTMHAPHACPPAMHAPLPCTPPTMHAPCHACPLPCTPPTAMHTPPLPAMQGPPL